MNSKRFRRRSPTALTLSTIALLLLSGCHYSLLNRSNSLAAWSPDGCRLAVCVGSGDGKGSELWLVEPESGTTRKLLNGGWSSSLPHLLAPRWTPDGKTLYCARTIAGEEDERRPAAIVGIDIDSGAAFDAGLIHYTGSPGDHFAATEAFIPLADGTLAAQDLGQDNVYRLVRIDPATGVQSGFASLEGQWMVISGCRGGHQLAVAVPGSVGAGTRITIIDDNGRQLPAPLELWPADDGAGVQPILTWSPTADSLAIIVEDTPPPGSQWSVQSTHHTPEEEEGDDFATLLLLLPDDGRVTPVAHDLFGLPPVYSPDGKHLAYAAGSGIRGRDGDLLLETRVLAGLAVETDVSLPGLALPLAWSADSSKLAYYLGQPDDDNSGTVISVAVDGSGTQVVSRHQQDRLAVAAPTGGRLAWVSGDGAVQVLTPGAGQVLFCGGLTVTGALQAGEDHLRQGRPAAALSACSILDSAGLDGEKSARLAAVSFASLNQLQRAAEAAVVLEQAVADFPTKAEPALAFLTLGGVLSDFGFRREAERLVEQQLLARYPQSPEAVDALWALAALKQSEGDDEASLDHLQRLLRDYPEERREVTRALLLAALAEAGQNPPLVLELAGLIIEANGDLANGDLANGDQKAPRLVAYYARGQALEQSGSADKAREAYRAAIAERTETRLSDGRDVEDLCWEALYRLARSDSAVRH
jgi:tetratricopeptide (TPR) repeat protein